MTMDALNPIELLRAILRKDDTVPKEVRERLRLRGVDAWAARELPTMVLAELENLLAHVKREIAERKEKGHVEAPVLAGQARRIHEARTLYAELKRYEWNGERLNESEIEEIISRDMGVTSRQVQRYLKDYEKY